MSKLNVDVQKLKKSPALNSLMGEVTSKDYQLGYFQDIYDLPYTHKDLSHELEAKEWIALLEHAWKFVYRAAIEDNHLSENERMDLNNIHKLRNFYAAQLRSGQKLQLHHSFVRTPHKVRELDYENQFKEVPVLKPQLNKEYNPNPEQSVNNERSAYYVPKPWEVTRLAYRPNMY